MQYSAVYRRFGNAAVCGKTVMLKKPSSWRSLLSQTVAIMRFIQRCMRYSILECMGSDSGPTPCRETVTIMNHDYLSADASLIRIFRNDTYRQ